MPSAAVDFRAVCGCFLPVYINFMMKRAKLKAAMKIAIVSLKTRVDGVMLGLLLVYLFWGSLLLQCGDVELNPGPTHKDSMRQTRLTSGGNAATTERTDGPQNTPSKAAASTQEPTLSDVMTTLQTMNSTMTSKLDGVSADVGLMREQFAELQGEVKGLREEVSALRLENDELKQSNYDMKTRLDELERKTDDLEGRSKRNNLIFYGLPRQEKETGADCEDMLRDLITDKLELADEIVFDRVHRLSSKPNSPVIARCAFFKDKVKILKAKRKLQGSNIFIGEDFCARVRDIRRKLTPHLKAKRNEGCRVSMVFDHLLVDGKRFTVDDYNNLTEIK